GAYLFSKKRDNRRIRIHHFPGRLPSMFANSAALSRSSLTPRTQSANRAAGGTPAFPPIISFGEGLVRGGPGFLRYRLAAWSAAVPGEAPGFPPPIPRLSWEE